MNDPTLEFEGGQPPDIPPDEWPAEVPGFVERLAEEVERNGGVATVASVLEMRYSTLYNWVTGRSKPNLIQFAVLCCFLDTTPDKLLGTEPNFYAEADRLRLGRQYRWWRGSRRRRRLPMTLKRAARLPGNGTSSV